MGWGQLTNHAWSAGLYSFSEKEIEKLVVVEGKPEAELGESLRELV